MKIVVANRYEVLNINEMLKCPPIYFEPLQMKLIYYIAIGTLQWRPLRGYTYFREARCTHIICVHRVSLQ